ncbi:MAG: hypothetical protein JO015_18605 [Verrucomicrobia bacterium]|nr:hypothetical protein [Verrucomicrobiota bacterium]
METRHNLRPIVENWLTDVQRRGAELYARHESNGVEYLSFEGKDHIRYSIDLDYTLEEINVQVNNPATSLVNREKLDLTEENLRTLAKRIAPLRGGYACIPVSLLAQLTILCHAYQRLVADFDAARHIHTSTQTVQELEAELKRFLTPEEQRRTDNPLLTNRLKRGTGKS